MIEGRVLEWEEASIYYKSASLTPIVVPEIRIETQTAREKILEEDMVQLSINLQEAKNALNKVQQTQSLPSLVEASTRLVESMEARIRRKEKQEENLGLSLERFEAQFDLLLKRCLKIDDNLKEIS